MAAPVTGPVNSTAVTALLCATTLTGPSGDSIDVHMVQLSFRADVGRALSVIEFHRCIRA